MGKFKTLGSKLGRTAGLSAMALAALSLAVPTGATAQDRDSRGPGRSEARVDGPGRPMMQNRVERPRDFGRARQSAPQVVAPVAPVAGAPRIDNRSGRDFRAGRSDGQQRAWRGQGSVNGGTWQQQRQGVRSGAVDGRNDAQWRERRQNGTEAQANVQVNRAGRDGQQWRDRNDDGRPDSRSTTQGTRGDWQNNQGERQGNRAGWQNNRPAWQEGRRDSGSRDNSWRSDRGGQRSWDRGWRSNSRYDWSNYRARNRTTYRLGRYNAPYANYRYNRIGIGYSLNSLFYGQNYWVSDPWQYRLPEVYGPYRWVRYYDDVVLVDIYSGDVVDVIYDFFW
jgi:hypothetical protein